MLTTDLKTAIRNLLRNKVQTSISILGLGIGLGSIILLMALIVHEKSFDKFIPDYKNVYRILSGQSYNTAFPLADEMKKDFPEVKDFFRICQAYNIAVGKVKNEMIFVNSFAFSDTSIYKIHGIKMIAGRAAKTVSEVAISERTALKYFGNVTPVGEILIVKLNPNELISLTVSGIFSELPPNSSLFPEFIANIMLTEKLFVNFKTQLGEYGTFVSTTLTWDNASFFTYVVLDKNTDKVALASKMGKYKEILKNENARKEIYSLQPLREIYLHSSELTGGYISLRRGNSNELKYYWAISLLILLISVTNYIFLTKASTTDRLHELGTRKVLGASQNNLRKQILTESVLVTILSLIPATFVIDSGINFINRTMNQTLSAEIFTYPVMWLLLIAIVIFTGALSGLLIGFKVSRTPSLFLLTGKTSEKSRSNRWNYSFLIFHFCIYTILVMSVLTVTKQIKYSLTEIKGINPKNILVSYLNSPKLQSGFAMISNEMERIPGVLKVAGSSFIPPFNFRLPITLATPEGEKMKFDGLIMGEGMTELLGIEVIDGSTFGKYQSSSVEVLFNESSAKKFNLKAGEIYLGTHIKGIVKDFHSHSFHTSIQPMAIIQQNPAKLGLVAIKTDGTNDQVVKDKLRELFKEIEPDEIFDVRYLTDTIDSFYTGEKNQAKIIGAFSLLAMVLAIMGLFGIALISIKRKTKEIGLRKVNGATVFEVIYLLNKDFVIWVLLSLVLSIPLSFYLMSSWQNRFAYKTELSWWLFALAATSAVMIAILTVSWNSWKAATRNPVEALHCD
jgi:putative ABC transport system permease protein